MRILFALLLFVFSSDAQVVPSDYNLVFDSTFNYVGAPDPTKWSQQALVTLFGCSTSSGNAIVDGTQLVQSVNNNGPSVGCSKQFTESRLITYQADPVTGAGIAPLFEGEYGIIKARIKFAGGTVDNVFWAKTHPGNPTNAEIDMPESLGRSNSYQLAIWCPSKFSGLTVTIFPGVDLTADFHTYGMVWKPDDISFYFDDRLVQHWSSVNFPAGAFNQPIHLILSAGAGSYVGYPFPASGPFPASMYTRFVRWWQQRAPPPPSPTPIPPSVSRCGCP